jgi:Acetyltransferase (GNAT) domain
MRVELLTPDNPRWPEILRSVPHDVYHLPGYVSASARHEGGEPYAFVAEEGGCRLLLPLVVRSIDPHIAGQRALLYDATSPYGYPGPLLACEAPSERCGFLDRAVDALRGDLQRRRIITCFVRLHPLFNVPLEPLLRIGPVVPHGHTVSIDLTLSDEAIWVQTRKSHRQELKRAAQAGHVARMDERWELFDTFIDLYYESMRRLGAVDYYYFSRDYFCQLKDNLGPHLHLCVVEIGAHIAAAGLFTEIGGIMQFHLAGIGKEFIKYSPVKTMLHFVRYWAKERGNRIFHLGGGLGAERDSLFQFKAGFSRRRHPFFTWRVVSDESAYVAVLAGWRECHKVEVDGPDGFFPGYRKPILAASRGSSRESAVAGRASSCHPRTPRRRAGRLCPVTGRTGSRG